MKVRRVMTEEVVTVDPEDTVGETLSLLAEEGVSGAPVTSEGEVKGIITESDLFKEFKDKVPRSIVKRNLSYSFNILKSMNKIVESHKKFPTSKVNDFLDQEVREVMTKDVYSVSPDESIKKVSKAMDKMDINHVPVVENGEIVGIMTRSDVVVGLSQM